MLDVYSFSPLKGNSRVVRKVIVVGKLIAIFCQIYREWDKNLPLLNLAYRSTVHEVTDFTPNCIMTGREIALPLDIMLCTIQDSEKITAPEYIEKLQSRLGSCFEEGWVQLKKYGEKQRKYYKLSIHGEKFKPGDLVYLREKMRQKQVCPKLVPKWRGPYMVIRLFSTVYDILTALKVSKLSHFYLFELCHVIDIPSWIKRAR